MPEPNGGSGVYTPANRAEELLQAFFEEAGSSMSAEDPKSFYARQFGIDRSQAEEEIERLSAQFCERNGMDLDELIRDLMLPQDQV